MKPEIILKSDVLDILFENRNKSYGAYALRKNYNKRLLLALGGTTLLVLLFILLQSMKPVTRNTDLLPPDAELITVVIPPEEIKKPPEEQPKPRPRQQQVQTEVYNTPVIKPDEDVPETTIKEHNDLDNVHTGNEAVDGPKGDPTVVGDPPAPVTQPAGHAPAEPELDETAVREYADVMPSFNGDIVKFMLRNLHEADDLEAGERIVVRVKFVVTKEGDISNIEIVQSGRPDLDREVIRVIKKMPRWKPGMQSGRYVPVYFNMPVTFVSNSE